MQLVVGPPALDEYLRLRRDSGLTPMTEAQGAGAIANSWSFCHIRSDEGEAAAMGRVIGDGGWYFVIADMATLPHHQRTGLGRRVIEWLIADIRDRAPANPYITLFADAPGRQLYKSIGFTESAPESLGMVLTA
jgi:GNAT superfamily N-acetyltransferase